MTKPRVLVLIDWYKPFFRAGGPVRSMVNMVDHLHTEVDFHIITGDRDYTATEAPADLPKDQWVRQDKGEQVWYASPEGRSMARWKELLHQPQWDVVYINGDHNIPTVLTQTAEEGGATRVLKLRQIEPEFLERMFSVEDI